MDSRSRQVRVVAEHSGDSPQRPVFVLLGLSSAAMELFATSRYLHILHLSECPESQALSVVDRGLRYLGSIHRLREEPLRELARVARRPAPRSRDLPLSRGDGRTDRETATGNDNPAACRSQDEDWWLSEPLRIRRGLRFQEHGILEKRDRNRCQDDRSTRPSFARRRRG